MTFLRTFFRASPATATLMLACLAVWAVTAFQSGSVTDSVLGSPLAGSWILWGPLVAVEPLGPLRAVGAMFLHLDVVHVVLNMVFLGYLGWGMERALGTGVFTTVYFAGGIGASAAVLWMDPISPTAGASGAVYALMAVLVAYMARTGGDLRAPLVLIAVNIGYTVLGTGVSFWGHVGGLLAGAAMAWWVTSPRRRTRWLVALAVLGLSVGAVLLYVATFTMTDVPVS